MLSSSRMEKFTLNVDSMFLSEAFQLIIAKKYNIQIMLTRIFAYAVKQILSSCALVMMLQREI